MFSQIGKNLILGLSTCQFRGVFRSATTIISKLSFFANSINAGVGLLIDVITMKSIMLLLSRLHVRPQGFEPRTF